MLRGAHSSLSHPRAAESHRQSKQNEKQPPAHTNLLISPAQGVWEQLSPPAD